MLTRLIPVILVIMTSCNKHDGLNYIPMNDNIIDWGEYNAGSTWVYQNDSIPNDLDTIVVVKDFNVGQGGNSDVAVIDTTIDFNVDYFDWSDTFISNPRYENNDYKFEGYIQTTGVGVISWKEEYIDLGIQLYKGAFRVNKNGVINETINFYDNRFVVESIANYKILDKTYNEIAHITIYPENSDNVYQYWISKNNWIVKKILIADNKTYSWTLKESIIKQ